MMDVIRAREGHENITIRIDACEARIREYLLHPSNLDSILSQLDAFDTEVLEGDWGGYYESYRRPLIRRLDELRSLVGQEAPERSDDVWTRPAPIRDDPFRPESWGQGVNHRPQRNQVNVEVVLRSTGEFSSSTCSICLGTFEKNEEQGFASCGHQFHAPCIRLWARTKRGGNVPCPLCGQNISMRQKFPALSDPISATITEEKEPGAVAEEKDENNLHEQEDEKRGDLPEQQTQSIEVRHTNSGAQANSNAHARNPPPRLYRVASEKWNMVKSHFRKK